MFIRASLTAFVRPTTLAAKSGGTAMTMTRRALGAATAALAAAPSLARGQSGWPGERPIEVIVPYPPGGGVDMAARIVMPFVVKHLPGARYIVTNRTGAGGQIGFEALFNAAPDGYTLGGLAVPAISTFPLERRVRYRPMEFTFIGNVVDDPNTIYVGANSPHRTLQDLVNAAKARPGFLNYGTTGVGSDDHLLMLNLEELAGLQPMNHAPFAGAAPLLAQVLGGHIELGVGNIAEILAPMRDGRVRALGQASVQRWEAAPDVPTFREQGFDIVAGSARGIAGPPGLPEPIRTRLEQAFTAALADPAFLQEAERVGLPLRPLVGTSYQTMAQEVEAMVRALWQTRPWSS
jgi:tripartite-type tricarboxylate transporter receptor subunit TctC